MLTNGFRPSQLVAHFAKHRAEFPNLATEADYNRAADAFIGPPAVAGCHDGFRRSTKHKIRFNPATSEFAVLDTQTRHILTYYKADPAQHGMATNLAYFLAECNK